MIAAVLAFAPGAFGEREYVSLEGVIRSAAKKLDCRATLETLSMRGTESPRAIADVDFSMVTDASSFIRFIEGAFPGYRAQPVPGRERYFRVYDSRLERCKNYPLDAPLSDFAYSGTQRDLILALGRRMPSIALPVMFSPHDSSFVWSATLVKVKVERGSVRDALNAASVRTDDNYMIWRANAHGSLDQTKVNIGFFGYPEREGR